MARLSTREILWNNISRTCFQDRVMPYAYWFDALIDCMHHEHKKILNQSVSIFTAANFVRLLGDQQFIEAWPSLRGVVDIEKTPSRQGKVILDSLWSLKVTGFAFSQHAFNIKKPISTQLKATYVDICKRPNKNIYQVARDMNRPYSRVYADVMRLKEMGLVQSSLSLSSGRRATLLTVE